MGATATMRLVRVAMVFVTLALIAWVWTWGRVPPALAADWPASAVGRVLRDGKGPCSGVLVGARRVLTVGHCVARRRPWQPLAVERLSVELAGRRHAVVAVELAPRSPFGPGGGLVAVEHDWALLELATAAASAPIAYGGPAAGRRAYVLASPLVKMGRQAGTFERTADCTLERALEQGRSLLFRCGQDDGHGKSGSALLVADRGGWEVIAVQSAAGVDALGTFGLAVAPDLAPTARP